MTREHLEETLQRPLEEPEAEIFSVHPYFAFEVTNFVNGRRSVAEIAQAVSAEFVPVSSRTVAAYLKALQAADLLEWTSPADDDR